MYDDVVYDDYPIDANDDCHVVESNSKESTYDTYKCIVVNVLFYRLGCAGPNR